MQTANPALSIETYTDRGYVNLGNTMTISGVVTKTAILLLIAFITASWTWLKFYKTGDASAVTGWMTAGIIGGLILAIATAFKPAWSAITAPSYALFEGFFIGGLSAIMETSYPGIAAQASILTFGTLFAMLGAYQSGWIRATEKFKLGIMAATGGIALVYIISMVLSFFSISVPFIYGNGIAGIGFSLFVVGIAALNFVLDFDFIENAARRNLPKYMEWYSGFALLVTVIWLYIEFLRLIAKLRSRD